MFDLQARIHFHEPEPVRAEAIGPVDDEFNRARPAIADGLGCIDGCLSHCAANISGHVGGRRLFDDLLVAPLQ